MMYLTLCKLYTAIDMITVMDITETPKQTVLSLHRIWAFEFAASSPESIFTGLINNLKKRMNLLLSYNCFITYIYQIIGISNFAQ